MATIKTDYGPYYNPFKDLISEGSEYFETIRLLDLFAESSGYGGDLLPSAMMQTISMVEVDEIRNNAARIHHRAQVVYASLNDEHFKDLVSESWKGADAAEFESYIVGGGGHRGLDLYLEEVKAKIESQATSFINLCVNLEEKIDAAFQTISEGLADLKQRLDEGEELAGTSQWHEALMMALTGAGAVIAAIPVIGWVITVICMVLLAIVGIDQYIMSKTAEVAEDIIDAVNNAISESINLEQGNVDDLQAASW